MIGDYGNIRDSIARVVPGFENFNQRIREGYFHLPHPARDRREFTNEERKAKFTVHRIEIQPIGARTILDDDDPQPRPIQHDDLRSR